MNTVYIGGVPEHFNYPWYITLADKMYHSSGISLRWKDYYGGTGEMVNALETNKVDIAVILTEGIVKAIIEGCQARIVQQFVHSPLLWGIHVADGSKFESVDELSGTTAAISRFGSGSHLMAFVNAKKQGWDLPDDLHFELVRDLYGALEALPAGRADYFMWEKYTTKPYVDEGIFRRVGVCPTPWPCFVIAARQEFIQRQPEALQNILSVINTVTTDFKERPKIADVIAQRYEQKLSDVKSWLAITEWSQEQLALEDIDRVQDSLFELELVHKKRDPSDFLVTF